MVSMIEQIIDNGNAYVAKGNVWFSVESIGDYGALSGRSLVSNDLMRIVLITMLHKCKVHA